MPLGLRTALFARWWRFQMCFVQTLDQHRQQGSDSQELSSFTGECGSDAPATPFHYVNDYARVNVYVSADTESATETGIPSLTLGQGVE